MPRLCSVPLCHSRSGDAQVTLHSYPTEDKYRSQWITRTGIVPKRFTLICNKHFPVWCFHAPGKLVKGSLPTLHLHPAQNGGLPKKKRTRRPKANKCVPINGSNKSVMGDAKSISNKSMVEKIREEHPYACIPVDNTPESVRSSFRNVPCGCEQKYQTQIDTLKRSLEECKTIYKSLMEKYESVKVCNTSLMKRIKVQNKILDTAFELDPGEDQFKLLSEQNIPTNIETIQMAIVDCNGIEKFQMQEVCTAAPLTSINEPVNLNENTYNANIELNDSHHIAPIEPIPRKRSRILDEETPNIFNKDIKIKIEMDEEIVETTFLDQPIDDDFFIKHEPELNCDT